MCAAVLMSILYILLCSYKSRGKLCLTKKRISFHDSNIQQWIGDYICISLLKITAVCYICFAYCFAQSNCIVIFLFKTDILHVPNLSMRVNLLPYDKQPTTNQSFNVPEDLDVSDHTRL